MPVRLMYSANKGFYLSVTKEKGKKLDDNIPKYFQRVQKNKNGFTFTTEVMLFKTSFFNSPLPWDGLRPLSWPTPLQILITFTQIAGFCLF